MRLTLLSTLPDGWARVPVLAVGAVPFAPDAAELHVVAEAEDGSRLRIAWYGGVTSRVHHQVAWWEGWIVLGCGEAVYLVEPRSRAVRTVALPFYFQEMHAGDGYLLVLSGSGITRLAPSGDVAWENRDLAVDGVTLGDITDGTIQGDAEMDPPGGWVPFRVDLATDRLLERGQAPRRNRTAP
jgi:hypothetical protein